MAKAAKPQPDNELRLAWAAGLFEGEGSIGIRQDRPHANKKLYRYLRLQLDTTDKDVLEKFFTVVGIGNLYGGASGYSTSGTIKPVWKWIVSGSKAVELINKLAPFLGKRRNARLQEVKEELCLQ